MPDKSFEMKGSRAHAWGTCLAWASDRRRPPWTPPPRKRADMASEKHDQDPTSKTGQDVCEAAVPPGMDRRTFMMRSAVVSAAAVIAGCSTPSPEQIAQTPVPAPAVPASSVSPDLDVVKKSQGAGDDDARRVLQGRPRTVELAHDRPDAHHLRLLPALHEAAGGSAREGHRASRCTCIGSLSATGKGHGTERAALAGHRRQGAGNGRARVPRQPGRKPDQTFPVKLGDKTLTVSLKDIVYDAPKGNFPHPNTMTCKLMAGDTVLLELEYYSVGGGFIEWKGYQPPKKGQPKYPYSTMKELQAHARANKLSIAQVVMANEVAVSGKSEAEINAFIDKITTAMVNIVKAGLSAPEATLPGPIKLQDQGGRRLQARDGRQVRGSARRRRRVGVRAGGLGGERARPPRRHGADGRIGRRHARARLCDRRRRPQAAAGKDPRRPAGGGRGRLPVQAQRDAVRRGRRLPGGDRRRVGDGRGVARAGARLRRIRSWRTPRSRRCSITSA